MVKRPSRASVVLEDWLIETGTSQETLAGLVEVSQTTISALVSGRSEPLVTTAVRIADVTDGRVDVELWGVPATASQLARWRNVRKARRRESRRQVKRSVTRAADARNGG